MYMTSGVLFKEPPNTILLDFEEGKIFVDGRVIERANLYEREIKISARGIFEIAEFGGDKNV